jgi:hypothetical protein
MPLSPEEADLLGLLKSELARRLASSNEVAKGESKQSKSNKVDVDDIYYGFTPDPPSVPDKIQDLEFVPDEIQSSNGQGFDPSKPFWLVSKPYGFKELINEPAKGLILFSPSGRRFQWTNSAALTQADIEQLGRLETEHADLIKNSPEIRSLFNRTPNAFYPSGWVVSLLATFAVSWILARRRYNRQSGGIRMTSQETESNPASFRRASFGVRRLASTLFLLFTIGGVLMGVVAGGSDFRFTASLGLIMGLLLWVLIRGIDWIVRGFKFGG